jgi:acylphosphatase
MSERIARRLLIRGRVQGVGFREYMRQEAESLGLTGWVRNRADGCVEALVQGAPEAVEALAAWAHRGPPSARVDAVEASAAEGDYSTFEVRPTLR